jgi:hypothetical protein
MYTPAINYCAPRPQPQKSREAFPLSSGLSLNARGIMRSGMAGNSEGSGRECSHTTEEVIGVGQSAMSAGSICQICVVQPSPLLGRSHSIRLSIGVEDRD